MFEIDMGRASMDRRSMDRLAGVAGIVGVLVSFIGTGMFFGRLPEPDDAVEEFVKIFVDDRGTILAGTVLFAVGVGLITFWGAALRDQLRRGESYTDRLVAVFYGGLLMAFAIALASFGPVAAMAWRGPGSLDPQLSRLVLDSQTLVFNVVSAVPFVLFIGAASLAMLRNAAFPRWLGWLGVLAALVTAVVMIRNASAAPALDN
jgi:hypothetical protein